MEATHFSKCLCCWCKNLSSAGEFRKDFCDICCIVKDFKRSKLFVYTPWNTLIKCIETCQGCLTRRTRHTYISKKTSFYLLLNCRCAFCKSKTYYTTSIEKKCEECFNICRQVCCKRFEYFNESVNTKCGTICHICKHFTPKSVTRHLRISTRLKNAS